MKIRLNHYCCDSRAKGAPGDVLIVPPEIGQCLVDAGGAVQLAADVPPIETAARSAPEHMAARTVAPHYRKRG